ncbi:NADH-quinone oxidoreductase subunit NuoE [Candidatus Peregrinibacteria bacterium]|nr:NADH-quinone oxidoreductase subunit NuoE [Candidatus Peregrinibacteria bacterium]
MMEFSKETLKELDWIISRYPKKEAALLPALRLLEREFGEVSEDGMKYVAGLLDVSPAKVYGVITFYTHYRRTGMGKYVIQVCSTLPCALKKSECLYDYISEKLGVKNGETTADKMFTLKKVECLAACDKAPFLQINDDDYENMTKDKIDELLDTLSGGGGDQ